MTDLIPALSPRRQRRRARTAQTLQAAARVVFERQGYARTTLQDLVDEADVTHRTFYAYFGSKDAVFGELLDALVDEFLTITAGSPLDAAHADRPWGGSLRTRFRLGVQAILEFAVANRSLLVAVDQAIHTSPDHARSWARLRDRLEAAAEHDINWYVECGIMAAPANMTVLVKMMSATLESAVLDLLPNETLDPSIVRDALVDLYWNLLLRSHDCADDYIVSAHGRPTPVFGSGPEHPS